MMDVLRTIERYQDAAQRAVLQAEVFGSLVLFYTEEPLGWRYAARPALGARAVEPDDIARVRERQRKLDIPEAFEWIEELSPWMSAAMTSAGIAIEAHPLMVLGPDIVPAVPSLPGVELSFASADDEDLPRVLAVGTVAFESLGTETGEAGLAELEAAAALHNPATLVLERQRLRSGATAQAVARIDGVPVAIGAVLPFGEVANVVGVATLPAFRRRGLAQAISALLIRRAQGRGSRVVFLSAMSEDVARMYASVGFQRVGTSCSAIAE